MRTHPVAAQRAGRPSPHAPRRAFTLIELLVVIAIIAIMMAAVVPMATAVNDRARIGECEAHLQQVGVALRMYAEDHGRYPANLAALYDGRYLDQRDLLRCNRAEHDFFYQPPVAGSARDAVIAGCVAPTTPAGARPHHHGAAAVLLQADGKVRLEEAGQ
jgi:prepilin-type N-terminal cleavage/methylation domain-containing protein